MMRSADYITMFLMGTIQVSLLVFFLWYFGVE